MAEFALRIQKLVKTKRYRGHELQFRIGIHSGPVVAGIIGQRKFAYDLWGDTVNTASRLESHGTPGTIQISDVTYRLVRHEFRCEPRGAVDLKGRGQVSTWYLLDRLSVND